MKKWRLVCSVEGISIDYEQTILAETEPHWIDCHNIAGAHGCDFWTLEEEKT